MQAIHIFGQNILNGRNVHSPVIVASRLEPEPAPTEARLLTPAIVWDQPQSEWLVISRSVQVIPKNV